MIKGVGLEQQNIPLFYDAHCGFIFLILNDPFSLFNPNQHTNGQQLFLSFILKGPKTGFGFDPEAIKSGEKCSCHTLVVQMETKLTKTWKCGRIF